MVAPNAQDEEEIIYEVGDDPTAAGAVRPQPISTQVVSPVMGHYLGTAETLAKKSIERKIQAGHIVNHHGAMQMYLNNANLANVMGLTPEQKTNITPFPARGNRVSIVSDGSNEKLVGVMGDLVGKLIEKLPTVTLPSQPEQSGQPDTPKPETKPDAIVPQVVNMVQSTKRYGSMAAWAAALVSSITAGALAWNSLYPAKPVATTTPTPVVTKPDEPTQVMPPPTPEINGRIGVTIE